MATLLLATSSHLSSLLMVQLPQLDSEQNVWRRKDQYSLLVCDYTNFFMPFCVSYYSLDPMPICLQFNARSSSRPGIDCIWA